LSFIPSDLYRYLTRRALCKVSDKFFIASASSTGKYHPKYASGTGGLVRHTKACIVFAMELLALKQYSEINEERSAVISALILHDTCKSGVAWESKYTKHEHPLLVRKLLADGELYQQEQIAWNKICNLIESHMGQWTENNKSDVILPDALGYPVNEFVHYVIIWHPEKILVSTP
jgi:hypothetical protein